MKNYLKQFNIEVTQNHVEKLDRFCQMLVETNEKFNLTAITEPAEIFEKHFIDSILGSLFIPQNSTLCDVGSGAGFPAIPLKIVRQDLQVTTLDSLEKRVGFVKSVSDELALDLTCVHDRVEDFSKTQHRSSFDVVTARAVAPLNILLEYCAGLAKIGGIVLAYKTDQSEIELCKNAMSKLGLVFETSKNFALPSGSNRCLIVFKKISDTPSLYPRPLNKPRKNPL